LRKRNFVKVHKNITTLIRDTKFVIIRNPSLLIKLFVLLLFWKHQSCACNVSCYSASRIFNFVYHAPRQVSCSAVTFPLTLFRGKKVSCLRVHLG
jgi:hypothetical protein